MALSVVKIPGQAEVEFIHIFPWDGFVAVVWTWLIGARCVLGGDLKVHREWRSLPEASTPIQAGPTMMACLSKAARTSRLKALLVNRLHFRCINSSLS